MWTHETIKVITTWHLIASSKRIINIWHIVTIKPLWWYIVFWHKKVCTFPIWTTASWDSANSNNSLTGKVWTYWKLHDRKKWNGWEAHRSSFQPYAMLKPMNKCPLFLTLTAMPHCFSHFLPLSQLIRSERLSHIPTHSHELSGIPQVHVTLPID